MTAPNFPTFEPGKIACLHVCYSACQLALPAGWTLTEPIQKANH